MNQTPVGKIKAEMNVTPLVDVVLVLLIIFMVVTPLLNNRGAPLLLPQAEKPGSKPDDDKELVVSLDERLRLFIENSPVSQEEFTRRMKAAHERKAETPVLLRADTRLHYREVKKLMNRISDSGFTNISLMAEKRAQSK